MITLTLASSGAEIDLSVAHIVGLSPWPGGGTTVAMPTNSYVVRETREEVRAMVEAALAPAPSVDREAVALAAQLLRVIADAPDGLWAIVRRTLGVGPGADFDPALRALANRLAAP